MNKPPLIMTSDPGSFAQYTILKRLPHILERVMQDNPYPADIQSGLNHFLEEILHREIQPLHDAGSDLKIWNAELERYPGRTWLEVPFFFAETLFYRRLLGLTGYFSPGPWQGVDPFRTQKLASIQAGIQGYSQSKAGQQTTQIPEIAGKEGSETSFEWIEMLLHASLWGNQADLSLFPSSTGAGGHQQPMDNGQHFLVDDTVRAWKILSKGVQRLDILCDNVGPDLMADMLLVDNLLRTGRVGQVGFHLKARPLYVSDALAADFDDTLDHLHRAADPGLRALAERFWDYREANLVCREDDPFWTMFGFFSQMPERLKEHLQEADLVIVKGDANYRRLVEDRHWLPETRLDDVAGYFPAPFLALRTVKSEIVVGLQPSQAEMLEVAEPGWRTSGKYGLIQFVAK